MRIIGRIGCAIAVSAMLTGCGGAIGGGCSAVEMETKLRPGFPSNSLDVTLVNTSAEPKLVTLAIVDGDGSEINSQTMRVDAKGVAETSVAGRMREGVEIELVSCE